MKNLSKQERRALEAVARQASATWEDTPGATASLRVAGKRVAVEIATLKRRGALPIDTVPPRLRFDRVATRLIDGLRAGLGTAAPEGMTLLVTVTAPIRLPAKTTAAIEDKIRRSLGRLPGCIESGTMHGNGVQIHLLRGASPTPPRLVGFVHNPDADPLVLVAMTRELLDLVSSAPGRLDIGSGGERWLVVISARQIVCLQAYRSIEAQLRGETEPKKELLVFGDGKIGALAG
jgi:hypothetical protein